MTVSRRGLQRKTRCAIYCRISSDREGRELGVERQEKDCRAYANRKGMIVAHVYIDNDTGASRRSRKPRPKYKAMLAAARSGEFDVILSYTSGRLTRRPREHEDQIELAEEYQIRFEYIASPSFDLNTAAGRRVARILAANDAGEAEDIAERVTAAKVQAAEAGLWLGGRRPFGYEADGITVRESEAAEVLRASNAVLAGASLGGIARDLNARGVLTSTGIKWSLSAVREVLTRARNAGLLRHQGEVASRAVWPAIVPEDTWRAVCAVVGDPSRRTSELRGVHWRGSGLYRCGVCGSVLIITGLSRRKQAAGGTGYYICRGRQEDDREHVGRDARILDMFIDEMMIAWLMKPAARRALRATSSRDTAAMSTRLTVVRSRLNEMAKMFAAEEIDKEQLRTGSADLRTEAAELEQEIADAARTSALSGLADAPDVRAAWLTAPVDRQRAVISTVVESVRVLPAKRGRPKAWTPGSKWGYFDPGAVEINWVDGDG